MLALPANSLRRRLALLISTLVAALGCSFAWMAYAEVQHVLRASASDRMGAAAAQVADLLSQSATSRLGEIRRLAGDPDVHRLVAAGKPEAPETPFPAALQAFIKRTPQAVVSLHDSNGQLLGPTFQSDQALKLQEATIALPAAGVGALRLEGSRVWFHTATPVVDGAGGAPVGYVAIHRPVGSAQALDLIARLIGSGAELKVGNANGDVWTDLSKVVAAPPNTATGSPIRYRTAAGEMVLGSSAAVSGTPWIVWTEVSEATMLRPSTTLLRRMAPITVILTVLGAVAVYSLSARLTNELKRARAELDHFFSISVELLCIVEADGKFRRVNPAWQDVLGWGEEELTSSAYIDLVHPDDRERTLHEAAVLSEGGRSPLFENRFRCKDGSYRWLSWKSALLPGTKMVYAVAHDVTDQKKAARVLQEHARELSNANKELEAFSYSVSHDLRAPLRSIDGFAQALVEDYHDQLDDTGRDFLSRIRSAAQRMGTLIDDLLSLSRVTRVDLQRTDLNVTGIAREIADRLQAETPARQVDWKIADNLSARGDARLVKIALENLLANAWKFTSKCSRTVIEVAGVDMPGGGRGYVVRDNGAGFDMAHAGKLFGAFQRLHGITEFPGTGIGLATVHRVVRRHGGTILAEARPGQGAAFTFTLESL